VDGYQLTKNTDNLISNDNYLSMNTIYKVTYGKDNNDKAVNSTIETTTGDISPDIAQNT